WAWRNRQEEGIDEAPAVHTKWEQLQDHVQAGGGHPGACREKRNRNECKNAGSERHKELNVETEELGGILRQERERQHRVDHQRKEVVAKGVEDLEYTCSFLCPRPQP